MMAMEAVDLVIVGGGLAATRTAEALRQRGFAGSILMLSEESVLPYDRPPLSKRILLGTESVESIALTTEEKLRAADVAIRLSAKVVGLNRSARLVRLLDGEVICYHRLLVASGARPLRLPMLAAFSNVHVLRNWDEAQRLALALSHQPRVAIIGAGFIGLEIAASAKALGCEVTVIEASPTPLSAVLGTELGAAIQRWHERRGVSFHCGAKLIRGIGADTVEALELEGGCVMPVDLVVVGIGQKPDVQWLADSGLELHAGLVCDDAGRSSDPQIFGAGDAVCIHNAAGCTPTRHWTATTVQARRVADAIAGLPPAEPAADDHYFWSDQHGSRLQFAGTTVGLTSIRYTLGGPDEDRFLAMCLKDETLVGVFGLACPRDFLVHSAPLRG